MNDRHIEHPTNDGIAHEGETHVEAAIPQRSSRDHRESIAINNTYDAITANEPSALDDGIPENDLANAPAPKEFGAEFGTEPVETAIGTSANTDEEQGANVPEFDASDTPTSDVETTGSGRIPHTPDVAVEQLDESAVVATFHADELTDDVNPDEAQITRTSLLSRSSDSAEFATGDVETTLVRRQSLMNASSAAATFDTGNQPAWDSTIAASLNTANATTSSRRSINDEMFEGATLSPSIPKRLGSRLWSLLLSLIFVPVAWYFLSVYTLTYAHAETALDPNGTPLAMVHMVKLAIGMVAMLVVMLLARWSSLGTWFTGLLLTVAGALFIIIPGRVHAVFVRQFGQMFDSDNAVSNTLATFIKLVYQSGRCGALLAIGLGLLALAFVSFFSRRAGRKDMTVRRVVAAADLKTEHTKSPF